MTNVQAVHATSVTPEEDARTIALNRVDAFTNASVNNRNGLLAALEPFDFALLHPHLRQLSLTAGATLQEQEAPVEQIYFPLSGLVSLAAVMEAGEVVETATIGRRGAVGAFAGLGHWHAFTRAVVQIPGAAMVISASNFQAAVSRSERIRDLILRYKEGLLAQVQQTAACNALHQVEARLARWLLQAIDCVDDLQLPLTHDHLAEMLAVRRTTVTVIAGKLQEARLIRYHRGRIVVLDRVGLEKMACECYRTMRRRTDAVFTTMR
jgi:CRP-like cAMP-binding protein